MDTANLKQLNLTTVTELELIRLGINFQQEYQLLLQNIQAVNNEMMRRVNVNPDQKKNGVGLLATEKKK